MNEKKCKILRKRVRKSAVPSETAYNSYLPVKFNQIVDEMGISHLIREKGTPRTLDFCKRSVYQELKRNEARS